MIKPRWCPADLPGVADLAEIRPAVLCQCEYSNHFGFKAFLTLVALECIFDKALLVSD